MIESRPAWLRGNGLLLIGIIALLIATGLLFRNLLQHSYATRPLTITGGSAAGQRHLLAEVFANELPQRAAGLELSVTAADGSLDALTRVNRGELDLALVQGGLRTHGFDNLRQICALHVEPLHLLVRETVHANVAHDLTNLRGHSINLSSPGSGTHALALDVLRFAGLTPKADFSVMELGYNALLSLDDSQTLPDAAFMVSSLPSPVARHLINELDYRLVPIPVARAFTLDGLRRDELSESPSTSADADVNQLHAYAVQIPSFTYGVTPPAPPNAVQTLGTRLLLVSNKDVRPHVVEELLQGLFRSKFAQLMRPPVTEEHLYLPTELPVHEGVEAYALRNDPLISQQHWEWFEQTVNIVAVFGTGLFTLWIWFRQQQRRNRELSFGHYLQQVAAIENEALDRERRADLCLHTLLPLQDQLRELKREALENFGRGELHGEELLTGFLTQVTDVRSYLTRLILHERDNLEEIAREEHRPLAEVWEEAIDGENVDEPTN